jgi:hypothetical protein
VAAEAEAEGTEMSEPQEPQVFGAFAIGEDPDGKLALIFHASFPMVIVSVVISDEEHMAETMKMFNQAARTVLRKPALKVVDKPRLFVPGGRNGT